MMPETAIRGSWLQPTRKEMPLASTAHTSISTAWQLALTKVSGSLFPLLPALCGRANFSNLNHFGSVSLHTDA